MGCQPWMQINCCTHSSLAHSHISAQDHVRRVERAGAALPHSFSPLDGTAYVVDRVHSAYHHYLKVHDVTPANWPSHLLYRW